MSTLGPLLTVPGFKKNGGGGHLVRQAALVRSLRSLGREAFLFIPGYNSLPDDPGLQKALAITGVEGEPWFLRQDPRLERPRRLWDAVILDCFSTAPEERASWAALAPVLGIDEGGPDRKRFDFLLDLLPGLPSLCGPNLFRPDLLPLPKNRRAAFYSPKAPDEPYRILISFGAADPCSLALPAAFALAAKKNFTPKPNKAGAADVNAGGVEITALVTAGGGGSEAARAGIIVREHIPELRERLAEYDLLVTHFGLTAFEALHARLPVVLLSPAACHARLARLGGFPHGGVGPKGARLLPSLVYGREKALGDRCRAAAAKYGLENPQTVSLGDFLADLSPRGKRDCPVCGAVRGPASPVIARFPDRGYRRCGACGIVYMLRDSPPTIEYEADYFFGFYKSQYGKTYLEDFSNLTAMGKRRLAAIKALGINGGTGERLLDIGCAYGPFLAAARDEGFVPEGMDIASDAVRYIREELHIPARTGVFPDNGGELWQDGRFTVVSLWYVIEHFEDLVPVLKEINRLLKRGGVLAFSTPSFTGISGRSLPTRFLEKSPGDHYTVWSPGQCGKLLARYGFELKKVVITGHHPERFPLAGRLLRGGKGPLHGLLLWISRIFGLGDTFEAYAVKREDCHGTK